MGDSLAADRPASFDELGRAKGSGRRSRARAVHRPAARRGVRGACARLFPDRAHGNRAAGGGARPGAGRGDPGRPRRCPAFPRSTMDGYAVRAADTRRRVRAVAGLPAAGRRRADRDRPRRRASAPGEAVRIHTGAMLPPGADAVVMVEDTNLHGDEVEVLAAVAPGEDVLTVGEDIGARRPGRAGRAAAAGGRPRRPGRARRDRAAGPGPAADRDPLDRRRGRRRSTAPPAPAQVRDVNATTVAAAVAAAGGEPVQHGIVPDDAAALERALRAALADADAVVLSAGSSVSVRDLTATVVARLGPPGILVHGIAIRPGKPTVLAICGGVPLVGPAGQSRQRPGGGLAHRPAAGAAAGRRAGRRRRPGRRARAQRGARRCRCPRGRGARTTCPARWPATAHGALQATPLFGASNLIFTLVRADALIAVPLDRSGLAAGETVRVIVP